MVSSAGKYMEEESGEKKAANDAVKIIIFFCLTVKTECTGSSCGSSCDSLGGSAVESAVASSCPFFEISSIPSDCGSSFDTWVDGRLNTEVVLECSVDSDACSWLISTKL